MIRASLVNSSLWMNAAKVSSPLIFGATASRSVSSFTENVRTVTLLEGDGIGAEITKSVVEIFRAAGAPVKWEAVECGHQAALKDSRLLSPQLIESVRRNKFVLNGPFYTPVGAGHISIYHALALEFDLFAHVAGFRTPPLPNLNFRNLDVMIIRENTEDVYSGLEYLIDPDTVTSLKVITEKASRRVARFALEYAHWKKRNKVFAVHKANIMKKGDGLFLRSCQEEAMNFPDVEFSGVIIDNCAMQLVKYPERFTGSILLTPNLYGSIVGNIIAGMVGGVGMVGGYNKGPHVTVYEQGCRHAAQSIASKNIANPTGLLYAATKMLRDMGLYEHSVRIEFAIDSVLREGKSLTVDVGGHASTSEFTHAVISKLPPPGRLHRRPIWSSMSDPENYRV